MDDRLPTKKTFALGGGRCLSGDALAVATFPVRVEGEQVLVELAPHDVLDAALATPLVRVRAMDGLEVGA